MDDTGQRILEDNADQFHNDESDSDSDFEDALSEIDIDQLALPDTDQNQSENGDSEKDGSEQQTLTERVDQCHSHINNGEVSLLDSSDEGDIEQAAPTGAKIDHCDNNTNANLEVEYSLKDVVSEVDGAVEDEVLSNPTSIPAEGLPSNGGDGTQEALVKRLGLEKYFPEKITLQDVLLHSCKKLESFNDIPWYVLSKILMLDYKGRDDMISEAIEKSLGTDETKHNESINSVDEWNKIFSLSHNVYQESYVTMPNPMDVLLTVVLSSSNYLKQILCEKLFMCKLGIPLVIPPVCNHESVFLLWSLRNIFLECKLPDGENCELSVVKYRFPVVSCLRVGEISRSKSKFLNEILNDESHPTFFHRDCQNGMNRRILSEGLLEIAWYISIDQPRSDHSQNVNMAIVNLRGDVRSDKVSKSKKFLLRMSSVVLAFVDVDELSKADVQSNIQDIAARSSQLLLMLISKKSIASLSETNKKCTEKCLEILKSEGFSSQNVILDFDRNGAKNMKLLKKEAVDKIRNCFGEGGKETLENYKGLAENLEISVDENDEQCNKSKIRALEVMEKVCKEGMDNLKEVNLPLQCKPWVEWAKLNTEEHRQEMKGSEDVNSYMNKLSLQKRELRNKQLELLQKPNIFEVFIDYLSTSVSEKNLYFQRWLKIHLDEISRKILPNLQKKCILKWNEVCHCEDDEKRLVLQKELDDFEKKLAESSFGLEHFMREIAQVYEVVDFIGKEKSGRVGIETQMLPRIMAELLLLGYPMELMDGDAAHIPVKWVQAVFENLSGLIGVKKLFVLSVLGIQSSGKSTLLNTMFGLQFAVAAGRCTRGVYAQLVPVCKEYSNSEYDYILVVDTEGLRAAELGNTKLQHDNEIATFVIGLGDVTLINLKGENVSEMEDVLQIVIHALLKMCLVNKNLTLQPSCIFIHQNVSAPDASQKLRAGRQKFMETLDKVTKAAGKQEDAPQYTKFKQLIDFDISTNIWYVSDLWKGDPPMAPVNPGYSENVNKIKEILLTKVMVNRALKLNIEKFNTRLKDLWHGILEQNFVFSFKNSLEIHAYDSLEKKLSDELWPLKKEALEWFNAKRCEIENTNDNLPELCTFLTAESRRHLDKSFYEAQEKLQNFFATDDDKSLLEQWHSNAFLRLQSTYDDIIDRSIENLKCEITKKQIKLEEKRDVQTYVSMIMNEAKTLAEELRVHENQDPFSLHDNQAPFSEEELNHRFREKWDEWIKVLPQNTKGNINIRERINNILEETYRHDLPLLCKSQEERYTKIAQDSILYAIEKYVADVKSYFPRIKKMFKNKEDIGMKCLNEFLEDIRRKVTKTSVQEKFQSDFAQSLLVKVFDIVRQMEDSLEFVNKERFEICIAIFASQYICTRYSRKFSEEVSVRNSQLAKFGIYPTFENALFHQFSPGINQVMEEIKPFLHQQMNYKDFVVDLKKHICTSKGRNEEVRGDIERLVMEMFDQVQSYIEHSDIQCFRKEYIDEILHNMSKMVNQHKDIQFTKVFRIDLAVYLCKFALPVFCEKHKRYTDDLDQRLVYTRDNYYSCLESFKNFYFKSTDEQALAHVLVERLSKSIEMAVDNNMASELANDVRANVSKLSCKPAFLKAILFSLLEADNFREFYLYLNDTNTCFQKWLTCYVDSYLFDNRSSDQNRYSVIAFRKIEDLVSTVCEVISKPSKISQESDCEDALRKWIIEFKQQLIDKLSLPSEDLFNLAAGYNILSLDTFTCNLKKCLQNKINELKVNFANHGPEHQKEAFEENVYTLLGRECKGCTEKCPFCYAPCYLNTFEHTEAGIKHMALEHHSLACGRYRNRYSEKLVTANCSMSVASDGHFRCKETHGKWHPYKKYREKFPFWDIHGDPSVEATPYWKWFLKKYEEELAMRYKAKRPDIPESWYEITKEKAYASLNN